MTETPQTRWRTAWSYALTVKHLAEHYPDMHSEHSPAIYLLGSFSVELGLKAFIAAKQRPIVQNHDLRGQYADYLAAGGEEIPALADLVVLLAEAHRRNFWRYMTEMEPFPLPDPRQLARDLERSLPLLVNQIVGGPEYAMAWISGE